MWLFGRGSSGFSFSNTAEEVTNGIDATGLTAIIPGAASGMGAEAARVLALRGAHVIIADRNVTAGRAVKEDIIKESHNAKVDVMELDLSSKASVRKFADEFKSSGLSLNILINNAGIATNFKLSQDNIELVFATNHLGHFLLTNLLLDTMKNTARKSNIEGRIINVASGLHWLSSYGEGIRFDNINEQITRRHILWSYAQSKLANILHANELARRLKESEVHITANSLHPGTIVTPIYQHTPNTGKFLSIIGRFFTKNVQHGASTTCYVALHPDVKGISGQYFVDNNISTSHSKARDMVLAKKLWDFSLEMTQN
ncbi:short-chain dehydrogenase TIC 32, chloroplastic-like isoform X3 [Papaver somniferum]|uniref:short-chain dehydrogenase TIC 32, chloroplastic-like isoform X3 n=1 Tax=Papaver somniferum TaxID=3469 RepID=UPI000E6FDF21|nr:short-chain dehydrogenase TIC 32, chloroplastic-like isoform X3 [Papaver somniferum]